MCPNVFAAPRESVEVDGKGIVFKTVCSNNSVDMTVSNGGRLASCCLLIGVEQWLSRCNLALRSNLLYILMMYNLISFSRIKRDAFLLLKIKALGARW